MDLTVIELFAGVGGFRVGLNNIKSFDKDTGKAIENGKFKFLWANQWEPSTKAQPAFECYNKRFQETNNSNIDINKVDKTSIPDHNLLVGGFPCQDYSVARSLKNEMGIEGKKGVLWWDIIDVVKEKHTPFILLENVDRLLKSPAKKRGRDFAIMLKTLGELGYIVQWRVINAGEYSMPQKRRRVFIFASKKSLEYSKNILSINKEGIGDYLLNDSFFNKNFPVEKEDNEIRFIDLNKYDDIVDVSDNYGEGKFETSGIYLDGKTYDFKVKEKSSKLYPLKDILEISKKYNPEDLSKYVLSGKSLEKWEYLKSAKRIPRVSASGREYVYSEGKMNFPEDLNKPARTMLTSEGTDNRSSHAVYDEDIGKIRKITEVEAELIQMFPANWTNTGMSTRQRYFMMGNALVTGVISRLKESLENIILDENPNLQLNFFSNFDKVELF